MTKTKLISILSGLFLLAIIINNGPTATEIREAVSFLLFITLVIVIGILAIVLKEGN